MQRERNIMRGQSDLTGLEGNPDAQHLVAAMIERDPEKRPTSRAVLRHPFFWDDDRRLTFLVDFSDRLELEPADSLLVSRVGVRVRVGVDRSMTGGWPSSFTRQTDPSSDPHP